VIEVIVLRARGILLWAAQTVLAHSRIKVRRRRCTQQSRPVEVAHVAVLVADDLDGDVTRVDERAARERPCACLISGQL